MVRLHVKVRLMTLICNSCHSTVRLVFRTFSDSTLAVQRSDTQEFLADTTVEAEVSQVVKQVVELNNLKHKIERLRLEGGELARFGPALSPEDQEELEEQEEKGASLSEEGLTIDPTGRRSGEGASSCLLRASKLALQCIMQKALTQENRARRLTVGADHVADKSHHCEGRHAAKPVVDLHHHGSLPFMDASCTHAASQLTSVVSKVPPHQISDVKCQYLYDLPTAHHADVHEITLLRMHWDVVQHAAKIFKTNC